MEGTEFQEIIGLIASKMEVMENNNNEIRNLENQNNILKGEIYALKKKLRPVCAHNYGRVYKQQMTPSKEVNAQQCTNCLHVKYLNTITRSNSENTNLYYT